MFKDKQELAKDFNDIKQRNWATIAVLLCFTLGLYSLWYLYTRYKRTKDDTTAGSGIVSVFPSIIKFIRTAATWRLSNSDNVGISPYQMESPPQSDNKTVAAVKELLSKGGGLTQKDDDKGNGLTALEEAENIVVEGDTARENENYENAITDYETALHKYEQVMERVETDEREASTKGAIAETQNKLDTVRERKERIDAVRNPLQNAESSLQTAIVQHAQNNIIPARRDYRQARDQYGKALDSLDELEENIFEIEKEITASVNLEAEYLPSKLVTWDNLSKTEVKELSDAGIGTLSDIRNGGGELIQELVQDKTIDKELANRLRAVKWWHGDDRRTFTSRATIERQRDRAEQGHQML